MKKEAEQNQAATWPETELFFARKNRARAKRRAFWREVRKGCGEIIATLWLPAVLFGAVGLLLLGGSHFFGWVMEKNVELARAGVTADQALARSEELAGSLDQEIWRGRGQLVMISNVLGQVSALRGQLDGDERDALRIGEAWIVTFRNQLDANELLRARVEALEAAEAAVPRSEGLVATNDLRFHIITNFARVNSWTNSMPRATNGALLTNVLISIHCYQ